MYQSLSGHVETIPFKARDGLALSLLHAPQPSSESAGQGLRKPVLLVHGAGVRANIFRPPGQLTLVDMLHEQGYDVWLLNWRASIDVAPNEWSLDDAAVCDHPAAVRTVLDRTGADELPAIIHCQGSTSFMMAAVAGLLPEVSTVISNAVSLHPVVPSRSRLKSKYAVNTIGRFLPYLNPQWGLSAPRGWPAVIDGWVRATHHECQNPVCKHSSFTYGAGFPTLWRHENLSDEVHEWIKGEFAQVPMTFFRQLAKCIEAGHLVPTGRYPELPDSLVAQAPRTDARFVFLAGAQNDCFRSESQARTYDFFDRYAPARCSFYELAGYGHLDVFLGRNAARDVFPLIIDELRKG